MKQYDIFISYRRSSYDTANLIATRLKSAGYSVFFDMETLRSGKFNEQLYEVIDNCKDFLVILPPEALARCVNEDDWVRLEVCRAMNHGKNIIPVMLNGFIWPNPMPKGMEDLCNYQALTASSIEYFDLAMERLQQRYLTAKKHFPIRKVTKFAGITIVSLLAVVGILWGVFMYLSKDVCTKYATNITMDASSVHLIAEENVRLKEDWKVFNSVISYEWELERIAVLQDNMLDRIDLVEKNLKQTWKVDSVKMDISDYHSFLLSMHGINTEEIAISPEIATLEYEEYLKRLDIMRTVVANPNSMNLKYANTLFEVFEHSINSYYASILSELSSFPKKSRVAYESLYQNWIYFPTLKIDEEKEYYEDIINKESRLINEIMSNNGSVLEKADFILEEISNDLKKKESDLDSAAIYSDIAFAYYNNNDYKQALLFYEKSLSVQEKILPIDNPFISKTYSIIVTICNNIGLEHYQNGENDKALEIYNKALEIMKKNVLQDDLGDLPITLYVSIGMVYKSKGDYDEALKWFTMCSKEFEKIEDSSYYRLILYDNIGELYKLKRDYDKSIEWYEKSKLIQEKLSPLDSVGLSNIYSTLGNAYCAKFDYDNALKYYDKCRVIQEKLLSFNDEGLSYTYNFLGNIYLAKSDYDNALKYYDKCREIQEKIFPLEHPNLGMTYANLGMTYSYKNNYKEAALYLNKALDIHITAFGVEHSNTKSLAQGMYYMYENIKKAYKVKETDGQWSKWIKIIRMGAHMNILLQNEKKYGDIKELSLVSAKTLYECLEKGLSTYQTCHPESKDYVASAKQFFKEVSKNEREYAGVLVFAFKDNIKHSFYKEGDIVVAYNGKTIKNHDALKVEYRKDNDGVETILRLIDGHFQKIDGKMGNADIVGFLELTE